jgi:hypothetical protein
MAMNDPPNFRVQMPDFYSFEEEESDEQNAGMMTPSCLVYNNEYPLLL